MQASHLTCPSIQPTVNTLVTMPILKMDGNMFHSTASSAFWVGVLYNSLPQASYVTNMQAYKIYGQHGVYASCAWIYSSNLIIKNFICADMPRTVWVVLDSVVTDSVFVLFSNNKGDITTLITDPDIIETYGPPLWKQQAAGRTLCAVVIGGPGQVFGMYDGPAVTFAFLHYFLIFVGIYQYCIY